MTRLEQPQIHGHTFQQETFATWMGKRHDSQVVLRADQGWHLSNDTSKLHRGTITTREKKKVITAPPMQPSQVFLGDNSISLVLPKKYPTRQAKISLQMTMKVGSINQHRPSKVLFRIALPGPRIRKRLKQFQAKSLNWYLMNPFLRDRTNRVRAPMNPQNIMKLWQSNNPPSHQCLRIRSGSLLMTSLPRMQQNPSPKVSQFRAGVMGIWFSFSSLLVMLFTSLYMPTMSAHTSSPTQKCPMPIRRMQPTSMQIVVDTRVKKLVFSLVPTWVLSIGAFFVASQISENQFSVTDSSTILRGDYDTLLCFESQVDFLGLAISYYRVCPNKQTFQTTLTY